ncbi:hypothetical protein [Guggenheimella bovis]
MAIFESTFDILYLVSVIYLGIKLFIVKGKEGYLLFASMAVLLGLGDAFHLVPRIISHCSESGFKGHAAALSWGQFVTSITMTLFYVLFYFYYRLKSKDTSNTKAFLIMTLALARIIIVLLPGNKWGQMPGDYMYGIYRNIPFLILGILLILWSFKERKTEGLKNMWWLIFLSFLFYVPVVLWSQKFPPVGALMMPKTVAYFMIVFLGFKYLRKNEER